MSKMMACTDKLKVAPFTSQPQVTPGRQRSWGHRDKPWEAAARTGTEVQARRGILVPKNISEFSSKIYIPTMHTGKNNSTLSHFPVHLTLRCLSIQHIYVHFTGI